LQMTDNGVSHALLIVDVRGKGDDEVFVVADPGGDTYEVRRADLIAGQDFAGSVHRAVARPDTPPDSMVKCSISDTFALISTRWQPVWRRAQPPSTWTIFGS